ncbi:MAG: hypothetical protein A4E72_01263 [Syntrophus sp. PtaU1.Bin208]|nr:MAG: hypothetical protein A4E72_01263 [Syntrophus sp. PtaU1.Bin208]
MGGFVEKLAQEVESHAEEIAQEWAKAVRRNSKTSSFKKLSQEHCTLCAKGFYQKFVKVYFNERPYPALEEFFSQYAEARFQEGIPLQEAIYALLMLRRQMWLFPDCQTLFAANIENSQAVDTLNQTIRIFDQGIYLIMERYQELSSRKG